MTAPLIISVSGLRGTIGETLTPDVAQEYALAAVSTFGSGPILLARDSRRSGAMLADAIAAVLVAAGRTVLDAGIAATPTVGILVRRLGCAGGIQISASHNPIEFNGLKIFSAEGRVVPKTFGEKILAKYGELQKRQLQERQYQERQLQERNEACPKNIWVSVNELGHREMLTETINDHLSAVLATVDVEKIRACKFRVLLDSNRGAGSILGLPLLQALNCDVVACGEQPDGQFEHTPEPIEPNLREIGEKVRRAGCDVGFCQDPDADRLALIDARGHYCGEEYTTALCAMNRLEKFQKDQADGTEVELAGPLVINCATSRMTIDLALRYGTTCLAAPVGEANVVDCMIANRSLYGGEGNGGPIDPTVGYVRDSFVGMAQILELAARRGATIADLVGEIPRYAIVKEKIPVDLGRVPVLLDRLCDRLSGEQSDLQSDLRSGLQLNRQDGLRIDWPDRWVLIRASNTEPIMRVIAEAQDEETALALCRQMEEYLNQIGEKIS